MVCFASKSDLERALEKYQGYEIEGRELKLVDDSRSRRFVLKELFNSNLCNKKYKFILLLKPFEMILDKNSKKAIFHT